MVRKVLLLAVVLLAAASSAFASDNLLLNPNFDDGGLAYWKVKGVEDGTNVKLNDNKYFSAVNSVKFWADTNPGQVTLTLKQDFWGFVPNAAYIASAYFYSKGDDKLRDGAKAWVALKWYDIDNNLLASEKSDKLKGKSADGDWELFQAQGTAPKDAAYGRIVLKMKDPGNIGDGKRLVLFDNASVKAVPEPISSSLFIAGGAVLVIGMFRKKKKG